jgi:hypothetical protein
MQYVSLKCWYLAYVQDDTASILKKNIVIAQVSGVRTSDSAAGWLVMIQFNDVKLTV